MQRPIGGRDSRPCAAFIERMVGNVRFVGSRGVEHLLASATTCRCATTQPRRPAPPSAGPRGPPPPPPPPPPPRPPPSPGGAPSAGDLIVVAGDLASEDARPHDAVSSRTSGRRLYEAVSDVVAAAACDRADCRALARAVSRRRWTCVALPGDLHHVSSGPRLRAVPTSVATPDRRATTKQRALDAASIVPAGGACSTRPVRTWTASAPPRPRLSRRCRRGGRWPWRVTSSLVRSRS